MQDLTNVSLIEYLMRNHKAIGRFKMEIFKSTQTKLIPGPLSYTKKKLLLLPPRTNSPRR